MDLIQIGILAIAGLIAIYLVHWALNLRQIVELKYADVVVKKAGTKIYSADVTIQGREPTAIYYNFPSWIPVIGCIVKRMPLEIIQISVKGYETFAKANARFVIDVSVYCRIENVPAAAQKFPGTSLDDFKKGMAAIIISAVRKTTANYAIEDIISKRKEISDEIRAEIAEDFLKWGVELTNVAVETIQDAENTTVIHDISAKKEAEINSLSRQEIAIKSKQAEIVEAENRELAEKRKIQADEQIAIRAQEKEKTVATMRQEAVTKILDVERNEKVTRANIEADAKVKTAEGTKAAQVITAEGTRQANILSSEGEKAALVLKGDGQASMTSAVGTAEAAVIRAKKLAEAEGLAKIAEAQKLQQDGAEKIRIIEKDEKIGLELARALAQADIKFYGGGEPKSFMDLFKVSTGGLSAGGSLATFLDILKNSDPDAYKKALDVVETTKQKIMAETTTPASKDSKNDYPSVSTLKKKAEKVLKETGVIGEKQETVTPEPKPADGFPNKLSPEKKEEYKKFFGI
jgi:flotillin